MAEKGDAPGVVVVGSTNTDMVVASQRLPRPGETVLGGSFFKAAGGKGANQAVAAARAGAHVAFVGCVGTDDLGRQARENLAQEGIDAAHLFDQEGVPSGVALILVDGEGSNIISVAPGANMKLAPSMIDGARYVLGRAKVLLAQLEVPLPAVGRALAAAKEAGAAAMLNTAPVPVEGLPREWLEHIAILIANEEEMRALAGQLGLDPKPEEAAAQLVARGVGKVVVTLGREGGFVFERGGPVWHYPCLETEAIDTVGAGDCFCGWLAACLAEGMDFKTSIETASRAAAISVMRRGAQPSLPFRSEVLGTG
ncbi:MAG: ribokinase [Planctomycetota bacterium]|jgi:ribokinase